MCTCMHRHMHVHVGVYVNSEDNFWEQVLSSHSVGPGLVQSGKKCLSLLSPLTARSSQTLEKAHMECFNEPSHLILMSRHLPKSVFKRHQPLYR